MSALLRRLRAALEPRYRVDAELGAGGTSRVFLAYDPALDRRVAVKVLRPERATATAAEVFLQEARTAARLSHPNVVPVHEVGQAEGLFYVVMDYMEGDTLRDRLEEGPLAVDAALRTGRDLLEALETAHGEGLVHGDVKPANVFLRAGRALLGDFGTARRPGDPDDRDASRSPASGAGTPGYMAPEQATAESVDPRSDLYAAGLVLFEALTGRRWPPFADPTDVDWAGIPPPVARVLERALRVRPEERWQDARSFRTALIEAESRGDGRKAVLTGAAATILLVGAIWGLARLDLLDDPGDSELYDLAVLPCEAIDPADSTLALYTARVAAINLERLPQHLRTVPHQRAFRWWSRIGANGGASAYESALEALETAVLVTCTLDRPTQDSLAVDVQFVDDGLDPPSPLRVIGAAADAPVRLGEALALNVLQRLRPGQLLSGESSFGALRGRPPAAVQSFLLGEDAFQRDARCTAERYYRAAVESDPTFALARWRLTDLRRYVSAEEPDAELDWLLDHADQLGPVDRWMLTARAEPPGPERLALYREALEQHPRDTYLLFTYGDELFHRGPLWGVGPDSAREVLQRAADQDSLLAPAWDHLLMSLIREGDRARARGALDHLRTIKEGSSAPACSLYDPTLLGHAFLERFDPERARESRPALFGPPAEGDPEILGPGARFVGPYLDLPVVETFLGGRLHGSRHAARRDRVDGLVAEALGLWARGRTGEALAHLDSAAVLDRGPEGRLHAAEWRVVPHALGLEVVPAPEVRRGRATLEVLAADRTPSEYRLRARFALGLRDPTEFPPTGDSGDPAGTAPYGPAISGEAARRARILVAALRDARAPDPDLEGALESTDSLLAYRSPSEEPGPFFRSALYLLRGAWQRALGRPRAAGASWMWHEAVDLTGEPSSFPQRGEIGWALGPWADARRADLAHELGRRDVACRASREALRHFDAPDPALDSLRRVTERRRDEACPS